MSSIYFALALAKRFPLNSDKKHKGHTYFSKDNIQFIKNIYKVTPETGNIDYFNCDCINFPEYIPSKYTIPRILCNEL
jgi:hypothetical protein